MTPREYYSRIFQIEKQNGWSLVRCCFHDDKIPSLSINLDHGGFNCFGCGTKGGDIIAFHQRIHSLSFKQAASELGDARLRLIAPICDRTPPSQSTICEWRFKESVAAIAFLKTLGMCANMKAIER